MENQQVQHVLLIDILRVPDALYVAYKNEYICGMLYKDTQWESQLEASPIWMIIRPDDEAWLQWGSDDLWASSGVIFEFDVKYSQEDIVDFLQKHITVYSEDKRLFFFRFYTPYTVTKILRYLPSHLLSAFMGIATAVSISSKNSENYGYRRIINPNLASRDTIFELPNAFVEVLF